MSTTKARLSLNTLIVPVFFQNPRLTETTEKPKEITILVWFDPKIDPRHDIQETKDRLNHVIRDITFYTEPKSCISFIKSIHDKKIYLVTSGLYASDILPSVGNLSQIDCIFIFCMRKARYEHLSLEYPKIVGIHVAIDSLRASIKEQIDRIDNDLQAFSFFDPDKPITQYLSKEVAEFLCFQIFNYVISRQPRNDKTKKQMIDLCREFYKNNPIEQKLISQFEETYQPEEAIRWYSKQSFIYKIINNALRKRDINQLYSFRYFIADLSQSLAREQKKIVYNNNQTLILYRGVKLSNNELDKFKKNEGKLVSSNGFLSTSRSHPQALSFARKSTKRMDTNATLIEIRCNLKQLSKRIVFADIAPFSEFPNENEVLFDLGSVFQLESVQHDGDLYLIKMNATSDGQTITENYIKEMRLDTEELSIAMMCGIVMCGMGQYDKAQQYFEQMLADPNGEDRAAIECQIGRVLDLKGDWKAARKYYDQAYQRMINTKSARIEDSTPVLNNIGNVLVYQERYDEALDFFYRALRIQEKHYPSGHISIATTLNNIGNILGYQEEYDEALKLHQRALRIQEKYYPDDHANIATTLTYIATILAYQGKFDRALQFHQRALKIKEKCYPDDHIEIATALGGIGTVLRGQHKYNEALEFHQRALKIQDKCYPDGHINTANTLNSMAAVLRDQEKYDEALEHLQRALEIKEKNYPTRHLDIAFTLNNIGLILEDTGDLDRAIEYHQKSLWMKEGLPEHHLSLGTSYGNLATAHAKKGQHKLALEYRRKYLHNRQQNFPENNPIIGDCLSTIGENYEHLQDPKMALKYYKQALTVYQKTLSVNHTDRQRTERNIQRLSQDKCSIQ